MGLGRQRKGVILVKEGPQDGLRREQETGRECERRGEDLAARGEQRDGDDARENGQVKCGRGRAALQAENVGVLREQSAGRRAAQRKEGLAKASPEWGRRSRRGGGDGPGRGPRVGGEDGRGGVMAGDGVVELDLGMAAGAAGGEVGAEWIEGVTAAGAEEGAGEGHGSLPVRIRSGYA